MSISVNIVGLPGVMNKSFLLDIFPGATALYGLKKLSKIYNGFAIRVRRSNDNSELDIGFSADGSLNLPYLNSFLGNNNGYVKTWYNQSSTTSIDLTQNTMNYQPLLINTNSNSDVAISFDGIDDFFSKTFVLNQPLSLFINFNLQSYQVAQQYGLNSIVEGYSLDSIDFRANSSTLGDIYSGSFLTRSYPLTIGTYQKASIFLNNTNSSVYNNGNLVASGSSGSTNPTGIVLGTYGPVGGYRYGNVAIKNVYIYPSLQNNNLNGINLFL